MQAFKEDEYKQEKEHESESYRTKNSFLRNMPLKTTGRYTKIFADDDYSGLYEERPAFEEMIREAEKGLFKLYCANRNPDFREIWRL